MTFDQVFNLNDGAAYYVFKAWEDMGYIFIYAPSSPESRESCDVMIHFFYKHLAQQTQEAQ